MQAVGASQHVLARAPVGVAEVDVHRVAQLAFDDRARDRAHRAGLAGVGLVEIPGVDLPVVRDGPGVAAVRLRGWPVPPQDQRIDHVRAVPQRVEHGHHARGSSRDHRSERHHSRRLARHGLHVLTGHPVHVVGAQVPRPVLKLDPVLNCHCDIPSTNHSTDGCLMFRRRRIRFLIHNYNPAGLPERFARRQLAAAVPPLCTLARAAHRGPRRRGRFLRGRPQGVGAGPDGNRQANGTAGR